MEIQNFVAWIVYSAIILIIAGPVLIRLTRNISVGLKLRKRRKESALLGVVYPESKKERK